MEDYYEYLDSNGVTTLYKLIKDDTVALIDSYSVTINGITTTLDTHINDSDIHTPISDIESMVDTKISGLVNSAPETLDTLKELSDALGNDINFATTVANQIGNKANKDSVYTKEETNALLDGKANSVHSHVVSDITDFPTIPTKLSQLENDMGFGSGSGGVITSVSWSDITDKPTLAKVATSGSYTDLSNTPTIPTKVSQLENDTGFVSGLTGVVDTKSNQTIGGTKTFSSGPWVTNNHNTTGFSIKNTALARNEIPTEYQHYTFRAYDKNNNIMGEYCIEKTTYGEAVLNMNVHSEDASDTQIVYGMQFRMTNDGSVVRFIPSANNKVHLGDVNAKWLKVHSDDVVHTSGNETINGSKTFTQDIILKDNDIDLTVTPSSTLTSNFIFKDKNNQNVSFIQYAKRDTEPDLLGLYIHDSSKNLHGIQITSNNYLLPMGNHIWNLGSPNNRWANAHIANTYTNRVTAYSITHPTDNSYFFMSGGTDYNKGATLYLGGTSATNFTPGRFALAARKTDGSSVELAGSPNGTLTWGGKNVALDENLVHKSGNETISGVKYFDNLVCLHDNMANKNSQMDLFTTPANTLYSHYVFVDKNNEVTAYMQYGQQNSGTDFIGLFIHDKNRALHGIQVTTNNEVIPISNNTYSLGSSTNKWAKVYSTNDITDMVITYAVTSHNNTSTMTVCGGTSWDTGSTLFLYGNSHSNYPGAFDLTAKNTTNEIKLIGFPNGSLTWGGKNIATTEWVTNYVNFVAGNHTVVNSVAGSGSRSASISAYYSNATTLTAEGSSSTSGDSYPSDYSDYINISPTVGTIYTGSQLFGTLNASASGSKYSHSPSGQTVYQTTAKATAKFSGAFSSSAKYLCTTANAVKFRAFVSQGTTSDIGTASVIENSSTKSIFIRIE